MAAIDLPPPLWVPPKPAIIRPAEHALFKPGAFRPATLAERYAIIADLVQTRRLSPREARKALLFVPVGFVNVTQPPTITYIDTGQSTSNASSFNYGNFTAASAGLMVVVVAGCTSASRTVSTVSIGGTNGTIHASLSTPTTVIGSIASRVISSGGNNVTVTTSGAIGSTQQLNVHVYLITGYTSATPTSSDAQGSTGGTEATISLSPTAPSAGIFGAAYKFSSGFAAWNDSQIEDADVGTNCGTAAAHRAFSAGGAYSLKVAWNASVDGGHFGATWQ